jgi:hypothetical protein
MWGARRSEAEAGGGEGARGVRGQAEAGEAQKATALSHARVIRRCGNFGARDAGGLQHKP